MNYKAFIKQAKELEKKYDWAKAADHYEQALSVVGKKDFLRKGEIQERIGYCFFRAAFQAETQEEFKRRMGLSVEAYEKAAGLFERLEDSGKQARTNFCRARTSYNRSWLTEESSERKALLDECWKLQKEALKVYEKTGDRLGYGKTCNELLTCLNDRRWFAWDWQERKNILDEAIEYGEKAIEAFSKVRDEHELARAYYMLILHLIAGSSFYESIEKQKEIVQKSLTYAQKALDISEKTGDSYLIGNFNGIIGSLIMEMKGDFESSLRFVEKQLELGTRTKDHLMIAKACERLAYRSWWKTKMEKDPDERRNGFHEAIQDAKDAITHCQLVSFPFSETCIIPIAGYSDLAFDETNLEEKRVLLEKAIDVGRKHLEQARRSGASDITGDVLHCLSKALFFLSTVETKISEKRELLEEASKYREECIDLYERLFPFYYWNRGLHYNYSALIKAELAKMETNNQKKKDLVRKAIVDIEDCLKFCKITLKACHKQGFTSPLDFTNIGWGVS